MLSGQALRTDHVSSGEMEVILQSITAGGLATPDAPLASTMLQSPSTQCNQLLRIADLQSVAIREESYVPEEAASSLHASSSMFLVAKLGYRPGEIQQPTPEGPPAAMQALDSDVDTQKRAMLRPPGLTVQVRGSSYNVFGAAVYSRPHRRKSCLHSAEAGSHLTLISYHGCMFPLCS